MAYQHYRKTSLGVTLEETIEELYKEGDLSPEMIGPIWEEFDKHMSIILKKQPIANRLTLHANVLHNYNYRDKVWKLVLKDAFIPQKKTLGNIDTLKIVACESEAVRKRQRAK